jgi:hypothetical protein
MALPVLFKLADLVKPATFTEFRDSIYEILRRLDVSTTTWAPGDPTRTQVEATALMFAALTEQHAETAKSGFLELAEGTWLRIKAKYDYDVLQDDATFATGDITLVNAGGGIFSGGPGDLIVRNRITGKQYRNVADFDLTSNGTITVTVIAVEAGTASNANAGELTEYVTEPFARVNITNATALIARDAESPAELRARCSEQLGAVSPFGPWDAYSYAARNAKLTTGESAGVTRTRTTRDGYGNLYLRVASASGTVPGENDDPATPLGAIDEAVQRLAAPQGVTAYTATADGIVVTVAYTAYVPTSAGLSAAALRELIAKALTAYFGAAPLGGVRLDGLEENGHIFAETVRAVIHNALPEAVRGRSHIVLTSPAGDAELSPVQVAVLLHNPDLHANISFTALEGQ